MGSVTQIRVLGGTIGLAVCSALLSSHVASNTSTLLTSEQQEALLKSFQNIRSLSPEVQAKIREIYGEGYNQQMRSMLYFSLAAIVSLVLLVEKSPRTLQTSEDGEIVVREEQEQAQSRP